MDAVKNNRCPSFLPQLCGFLHYPERIQQWITFLSSYEEPHPWGTALLVPPWDEFVSPQQGGKTQQGGQCPEPWGSARSPSFAPA